MRLLMLALALGSGAEALNVRVLVASGAQLAVRVSTPVPATPPPLGLASSLPAAPPVPAPDPQWTVGTRGASLTLNGQDAGSPTLYLPPAPGGVVEIAGRAYRGGVLLRAERGAVQGINVLDVEDYLRGVVPAEMPSTWPAAALAAQAVIARTYVAARINPALPFDTCATESCQVYRGMAAEKPGADAAIQATAGQVVAYGDRPASTYFSSDSGGHTASSAEVWGREVPYLVARADPYSAGSPRARWRLEVREAQVRDAAARFGVRVGSLRDARVTQVSASGRPQEITLTGAGGTGRVSGTRAGDFVRALGGASSRATLSGPVGPGTPLIVEGSGAGHGVGLSQYGALGLARGGASYPEILGFYYPGTSLGLLAGTPGRTDLIARRPLPTLSQVREQASAHE